MSPQGSNLVLSTNIPHVELDILECDGLDVEPDSGESRHVLVELQLVQDSGLPRSIEP